MARSSSTDPYDRYRFKVTIFEPSTNLGEANFLTTSSRGEVVAGFTEVTLPKATTNEITYRENVSAASFIKKPGLTRYEPVVFRRGVSHTQYLQDWHSEVFDAASAINTYLAALSALAIVPIQNPLFRRDILISHVPRSGEFTDITKHWYLYECFPTAYKPGNDYSASEDSKLIEEITVSYEGYVEVVTSGEEEPLAKVTAKAQEALAAATRAAAIGAATGGLF